MSEDRRELILRRLVAIAEDIEDIQEVRRNDQTIEDIALPAIVIFDGDEGPDESGNQKNKPGRSDYVIGMTPQISIVVADKSEDVGLSVNTFRARLLKAILFDSELANLSGVGGSGSTGNVRYQGTSPSVFEGRLVVGRMNTHFTIIYVLKPADL